MDAKVFFPARVGSLTLDVVYFESLFSICTSNCPTNNFISRQEKSIYRRNESTKNTINIAKTEILFSRFVLFHTFIFRPPKS